MLELFLFDENETSMLVFFLGGSQAKDFFLLPVELFDVALIPLKFIEAEEQALERKKLESILFSR